MQVIKDPIGTKGARLSTQISLAGRLLVHLPQDSHIGISQRIEDEAERTLLKETLPCCRTTNRAAASSSAPWPSAPPSATSPATSNTSPSCGPTCRAARGPPVGAGTLVHQDLTLAERAARFSSENTRRVLVDSVEAHKAMLDFALRYAPDSDRSHPAA